LTADDFHRAEAWLYSIPRLQLALEDLKMELDLLDARAASPLRRMPDFGTSDADNSADNDQAGYPERMQQLWRQELELDIRERRQQVQCFKAVLEMLRQEDIKLAMLVNSKYLQKMSDQNIWDHILHVSKATFYRMKNYVVEAFYDCLPAQLQNRGHKLRQF